MKNWETLQADENLILSKHFSSGRGGKNIEFIGIHHNAGNLSIQQTYNVWQSRQASAHYQVDINGRIGQLVHDWDTAWALGNFDMNQRSINIEHANNTGAAGGWTVSEATLDNGAHLVAALCKAYHLGRPVWGKNVRPHSQISPTACPGALGGAQRDAYITRAQQWYDHMTNGAVAPSGPATPAPQPAPSKPAAGGLVVDGMWGTATTRRLQEVLNCPYKDGVISRQNPQHRNRLKACTSGWEFSAPYGKKPGSQTISAIQRACGVSADGLIGPSTINALIRHFKSASGATLEDGKLDAGSITVKAMQRALNKGQF